MSIQTPSAQAKISFKRTSPSASNFVASNACGILSQAHREEAQMSGINVCAVFVILCAPQRPLFFTGNRL